METNEQLSKKPKPNSSNQTTEEEEKIILDAVEELRGYVSEDKLLEVKPGPYESFMNRLKPDMFAKSVSRLISNDNLPFPFKKYFMTCDPQEMMQRLIKYEGKVSHLKPSVPKSKIVSKTGQFWETFSEQYFGKYILIGEEECYDNIDILSDYFMEEPRVKSVGYGEQNSPMEFWQNPILHSRWLRLLFWKTTTIKELNCAILREQLYSGGHPKIVEARQGRPTVWLSLMRVLGSKRILDVASAWGDRLLAAIAHDVDVYVGVDANPDLMPGYMGMLDTFVTDEQVRSRYHLITCPSQTMSLPQDVQYDLVIMSPAPYRTEKYSNPLNQASNLPSYQKWLIDYLFETLRVAWKHMSVGGVFVYTALDRTDKDNELHYIEVTQHYIQYKLRGAVFDGVIWWKSSKAHVPFWVWRKSEVDYDESKRLYSKEVLQKHYRDIYSQIVTQTQVD